MPMPNGRIMAHSHRPMMTETGTYSIPTVSDKLTLMLMALVQHDQSNGNSGSSQRPLEVVREHRCGVRAQFERAAAKCVRFPGT